MRLPKFVVSWLLRLHESARATPYFDLSGYMLRDWILGYRSPERNTENPDWTAAEFKPEPGGALYRLICRHIAIRAHTILRSDQDRHLHDHPARSLSIVLQGGYWEVCEPTDMALRYPGVYGRMLGRAAYSPDLLGDWIVADMSEYGIHWRRPGAVVLRSATAAHRLILPRNTITKSIFVMGKKSNSWGFLTPNGKVGWREYLKTDTGGMQ